MTCPSCGASVTDGRFCAACGSSLTPTSSDAETRLSSGSGARGGSATITSSGSAVWHGRFAPGTVLEGRYRVVSLLGRGGMGEVYRADDLRLDQPVALKFLPESLEMDPARLARFHGEVRTARQVSHPNVCRVYDIGQADGRHFLSMEYIDGEDLASLLRRIGRLPTDKGIEVARQLCAGLAAAHERGVLHRDLKPANVMIDGAGRVRLTDFGIAGAADTGADVRAGTPAYMAPEQLAGREVSIKSDIYSLGLVLYEIFTGRRAFDASTVADLVRQHERGSPPPAATAVPDLHAAVERTVMRCLETDPALRPSSALAVAAGLPGASPLEAALAAGETPSPEMVAAAGTSGVLAPDRAIALLVAIAVALLVLAALADRVTVIGRTPAWKDPAVLTDRAEQIVRKLGYEVGSDAAIGFSDDRDYLRYVRDNDSSRNRWDTAAAGFPPIMTFWYRTSPRELLAWQFLEAPLFSDPPMTVSDMVRVRIDAASRLVFFEAVPKQVESDLRGEGLPASREPVDWSPLFEEAGLDEESLTPATESWTPPQYADTRAAWSGRIGPAGSTVRLEAAAHRGRVVYFAAIAPWTRPARMRQPPQPFDQWAAYLSLVLLTGSLVTAALMARHNVKVGRGDRRGAVRLGAFVFAVQTVEFLLSAHHLPDLAIEWTLFARAASTALFAAVMIWLLYLALEPLVRRFWPNSLIAWNRLLTGRIKDPMIGRDLLVGMCAGLAAGVLIRAQFLLPTLFGRPEPMLETIRLETLLGLRYVLSGILTVPDDALLTAMVLLLLLVAARLALRRMSLAVAVCLVVVALLVANAAGQVTPLSLSIGALAAALMVTVFVSFGLLAAVVMFFAVNAVTALPLTLNPRAWYFGTALIGFAAFAALALWGFRLAQQRAQPV